MFKIFLHRELFAMEYLLLLFHHLNISNFILLFNVYIYTPVSKNEELKV